jgi:hypothetical protein
VPHPRLTFQDVLIVPPYIVAAVSSIRTPDLKQKGTDNAGAQYPLKTEDFRNLGGTFLDVSNGK